jgi:predicted HicB family RNase H-like nuclease
MKKVFKYKGYSGSMEFSQEDKCLFGKILFVNDLVTYEAETYEQLEAEFAAAVDDYLETCEELGASPDKPFSGTFNVRVGPELHQQAAKVAHLEDITLNELTRQAIKTRVEKTDKDVVEHRHIFEYRGTFPVDTQSLVGELKTHGFIRRDNPKADQNQVVVH